MLPLHATLTSVVLESPRKIRIKKWSPEEEISSQATLYVHIYLVSHNFGEGKTDNTRKVSAKCLLILSVEMIFIFDGFANAQINKIS